MVKPRQLQSCRLLLRDCCPISMLYLNDDNSVSLTVGPAGRSGVEDVGGISCPRHASSRWKRHGIGACEEWVKASQGVGFTEINVKVG